MIDAELKRLALLLAVSCVRNTVIEDYHVAGKLSNAEMREFNIEVSNKLYTALHFLLGGKRTSDRDAFLGMIGMWYPVDWNLPELDDDLIQRFKYVKERPGHPGL